MKLDQNGRLIRGRATPLELDVGRILQDDELRAFRAVAEMRSFSKAASQLGIAQSSVSQRLARLETRVGRALIDRTTRRVELTSSGIAMMHYVKALLSIADDARRQLSTPPIEAKIRLGLAEEFALTKLADVLGIFRQQFAPRFEMTFLTGRNDQLFAAIDEDRIDMIVGKCATSRIRGEFLWKEKLVWVGDRERVTFDNSVVPLLAYIPPSETREAAERALLTAKRNFFIAAESENLLGLIAAAEAGLGVLPIGRSFLPRGLADVSAAFNLPELGAVNYVIDARPGTTPATLAIAAIMREFAKQVGGA